MDKKLRSILCAALVTTLAFSGPATAGSVDGKQYTNFGNDLAVPIFPKNGELKVYKNRVDAKPWYVVKESVIQLVSSEWEACLYPKAGEEWVRCLAGGETGWVKRADFRSGGQVEPVSTWPFRYWLLVADNGKAAEESVMVARAAKHSPYLVAPAEYSNVFFKVLFDEQGFAFSAKHAKKTGDRVFMVGNSVYLAPDKASARDSSTWLFLNFYNREMGALCPAEARDSCYSAVNLADSWPGIKALYTQPSAEFAWTEARQLKEKMPAYGVEEVAFARHADPIRPLMYTIPESVWMTIELVKEGVTDAQKKKNREKQVCLMDCPTSVARAKK